MRPAITRTLLAVAATLAVTVPANAAEPTDASTSPTTVLSGAGTPSWRFTTAARAAEATWTWIERDIKRQNGRRFASAPATTDAKRLGRLPDRFRVVINPSDLRANRWGQVERHLTFSTGSASTAVCLNLDWGDSSRGPCGRRPATDTGLVGAYKVLTKTTLWFDRRRSVFGRTADDLGLVRRIARTDLPTGWSVSFSDIDDDGRVDRRTVTITDAHGQCGLVTLPKRGVDGEYVSSMVSCG